MSFPGAEPHRAPSRAPLRVAIAGPLVRKQGLGPHMARFFRKAGAEVAAVLSSSASRADEAERHYRENLGFAVRGYADIRAMLDRERLDALAIASPHASHEGFIEAALQAGLHVFCEKPLIGGGFADGASPWECAAERALGLVSAFEARGRVLMENVQWIKTLPSFFTLFPKALESGLRRFFMRLSPVALGPDALADCLAHPLSLLQALDGAAGLGCAAFGGVAPGPEAPALGGVQAIGIEQDAASMRLSFRYGSSCEVELLWIPQPKPPREAAYAVNGFRVDRRVALPEYRLFFEAQGCALPIPDPLEGLIADFVEACNLGQAAPSVATGAKIAERLAILDQFYQAYESQVPVPALPIPEERTL